MQKFVKGRTNNHLTWVMVDATDFATPESNCSNITTIKIYGKVRGATGTNFVSSGTGSLTNDITHVGASATGMYTIALAKADLSDASAAWYDQYIVHLSATGSARQTLVVDGGIDDSTMLVLSDAVSNVYSAAVQTNSRALVIQSSVSDTLSDVQSYLVAMSGHLSNVESQIAAHGAVLSDLNSNFDSRVPKAVATASGVSAVTSDIQSYLVAMSAHISNVESQLTAFSSDVLSRVPSTVPTVSALSALVSDVISAVVANGVLRAGADPTGVVGVTGTLAAKVDWLAALSRNKLAQDATSLILFNDASVAIAEAAVDDDGASAVRHEFA